MGAAEKKAAPGPCVAGWLNEDPAPVVMRTDTRHGSVLHRAIVPSPGTEMQEPCTKARETPAICDGTDARVVQRERALLRANAVRLGRAQLKRDIKQGKLKVSELLTDPPALVAGVRAMELLQWGHMVGRGRARQLARGPEGRPLISDTITVGHLGEITRAALAERLALVQL